MTLLFTGASYFVAAVVVYYAVLFVIALLRGGPDGVERPLAFVIFVAALNEEEVIEATLQSLLALDHEQLVVCIGDDGSTDDTPVILARYSADPRVAIVRRELPHAQIGKSDVLNACFEETLSMLNSSHPVLGGLDPASVVVGIVDADGRLDSHALEAVAPYFGDPGVASVQLGVRIVNADTNLLTRMQDMEFVGFSAFVQRARDRLGSSGLGGNGQFTRFAALVELHADRGGPWLVHALTEDLELGLALICRGWRTRYCPTAYVGQQGLPGWKALFRQRTRWIQGHYRCWTYIPRLAGAPTSIVTRLDLTLYLLLIVTVIVVTFSTVVSILVAAGILTASSDFLSSIAAGRARNTVSVLIGVAPLAMFMFAYQRHALRKLHIWEVPAAGLVFTLYTYVWVLATARALARIATGRGNWVKTPRVPERRPGKSNLAAVATVQTPAATQQVHAPSIAPIMVCFGTRPEVVKLAPVIHELRRQGLAVLTLSTGQHREMLDQMLRAFDIEADTDLNVMVPGQTLGDLTGRMIPALTRAIELVRPSAVLVQGDTTTAMCAALAAFYADVPVGHVEAGLRTHDLGDPFPEEGNRRIIAQLADWHFSPTELGRANLRREGISDHSICVSGNTGIDAALWTAHQLGTSRTRRPDGRRRILVTMHRRESQGAAQRRISRMLVRLADRLDVHVVFPVHLSPAVRASVLPELERHPNVTLCDPLGYHDFIRALASADLVLTDSGGIQEEAPTFDVPVLVMRETTERPEGVSAGCARLCGVDPERIFREATRVLDDADVCRRMAAAPNPYGDGHAAERVVARLVADLGLEVGLRAPLPLGSAEVERRSETAVLAGGST